MKIPLVTVLLLPLVSALEMKGAAALPGSLAGVVGVMETDPSDEVEYRTFHRYGKLVYTAPPFPREIPGVPFEYNLKGVSFAVARISARVTSALFNDSGTGGLVAVAARSRSAKDTAPAVPR